MLDSKKIPFSRIVKSQLPAYVREEFPLIGEFLSQYYFGQEVQGASIDLIANIDEYLKISENGKYIKDTILDADIDETSTDIPIANFNIGGTGTVGFPESWGLLKIGDEIITYESKDIFNFKNCKRGFSGIASYENPDDPENLVFSSNQATPHTKGSKVENLMFLLYIYS